MLHSVFKRKALSSRTDESFLLTSIVALHDGNSSASPSESAAVALIVKAPFYKGGSAYDEVAKLINR
jgi:hypothetical protein